MDLDLSKPPQKVLRVKLKGDKTLELVLKRIRVRDSKAHDAEITALNKQLEAGELDGLEYSFQMLKISCEKFDEKLVKTLYDDELTAIWKKLRELKAMSLEESPEKKS